MSFSSLQVEEQPSPLFVFPSSEHTRKERRASGGVLVFKRGRMTIDREHDCALNKLDATHATTSQATRYNGEETRPPENNLPHSSSSLTMKSPQRPECHPGQIAGRGERFVLVSEQATKNGKSDYF